jgi:superfamily II DNA or RNA helicase
MTELRDYQNNAVERLEQTTKALYVLPTGGGKTIVATNLIERAVQRGERVLVLTHRREILQQTSLKLPIEHGLILAGLNIDLELPVQIASVQTLWARCMRTDKVRLPAANLIVIDEAHHVAAHTWQAIVAEYPNARLIGLSATPCRGVHKLAQHRKTLVFCVDVAHSVHVKDEFVKSGVKAEHIDGGTPKPERDAILGRLASGDTELVTNCRC